MGMMRPIARGRGADVAVSLRAVTDVAIASSAPLIVIADPDAELRDVVHSFMSARGYRVEAGADVAPAPRLLETGRVEVLICDLAMTGRDGELLAVARRVAP